MTIVYAVPGTYSTINAACTEIEASHDYDTDGIADVQVNTTTLDSQTVSVGAASAGTPSITNYIRIEALSAVKHDGTYNASKQRLEVAGPNQCIAVNEEFVHLKNLAIKISGTGANDLVMSISPDADDLVVEKCILVVNTGTGQGGIRIGNSQLTFSLFDCVLKSVGSGSQFLLNFNNTSGSNTTTGNIEHCIFDGNGISAANGGGITSTEGVSAGNVINIDNSYFFDCETGSSSTFADLSGSATWSGQGNATSDTAAHTFLGATNNLNTQTVSITDEAATEILVTNLTTGSENYQLIDGASSTDTLIGNAIAGATQDSRIDITVDCAGNARPGTYTDRDSGAFEVVAAGGSDIPALMYHRRQQE